MEIQSHNGSQITSGYQAPAVQKAFQILRAVAESPEKPSLSELAVQLGFSKSTTHGLVHALIREGALSQNTKGKKIHLGPVIVDMAFRSWNYLKIGNVALPVLEELRDTIGETVFLGVLSPSNARANIMATAEAAKPLKISAPPGTTLSLLAGAVGKVFLAAMEDHQALEVIRERGLPEFTPKSITREGEYLKELKRVRERGYALDHEEYLPGVKAVAVALGNMQGLPLAIWVVGFANAMGDSVMPQIIAAILKTTETLNRELDRHM